MWWGHDRRAEYSRLIAELDIHLEVPQGRFELHRPGASRRNALRAWDAADDYLLQAIADPASVKLTTPPSTARTLILNDGFGTLATALGGPGTTSMSDSLIAARAAAGNLQRNGATAAVVPITDPLPMTPDLVVLKIPKTLALLEDQLHRVRPVCGPNTLILAGGMVRNVHTSTIALFEAILGPTPTTLARRKARLLLPRIDPDLTPPPNPWPRPVDLDEGHRIVAYAGVFAGTKLDVGTRVLLDNLPAIDAGIDVLDLGCGNGIVGTEIARRSDATITFVDESYLALQSARETFALRHPDAANARFVIDDSGASLDAESFDLVVNNPPFHDNIALSDVTANAMFNQAHRLLRTGGELRVVGNRHLGYHAALKRRFGNCHTIASTPKFVVLRARKA